MNEQPILSEKEWAVVVDLLRLEQSELPVEIHHAHNSERRAELQERRRLIDGLLQKLLVPA